MALRWPAKDPNDTDAFHIVWCSKDGTNDGSDTDTGRLQGATLSNVVLTFPSGITEESSNTNSVTIRGVTYAANTVVNVTVSSGTDATEYEILCRATLSDGRILDQTVILPVKEK